MKKFLFVLLSFIIFSSSIAAAEKIPVKIARLPIIFQSSIPDADTRAQLETKIERATHIPLNQTLQVAEYLPMTDSAQTLNDIWQEMRRANKKTRLKDAIKPFAEKMDADIVVCPVLLDYSQWVDNFSSFSETYLYSYVRAELIVYDRRAGDLVDKKTSRMHHDTYSVAGTASYLAKSCFDRLIDRTKLRQLIMNIGKAET